METDKLPGHGLGIRHIQIALIFFMVVIMYTMSMAPPVGIVAMTNIGTSPNPDIPSFPNWTDQSLILTSFYWGFAPTQLFGGPLSRKYGFKWFMVGSMLIASLISIWIPALVMKFGSTVLIYCFLSQGLCQGLIIPMLSDFVSKWAPVSERTTIGTFIFSSKILGTVFATEVTGLLSSSWWGWPSFFYLYGFFGIVWSIFMAIFGCNNPEEHQYISMSELDFIQRGTIITKKRIPWSRILVSLPVWSLWITQVGIIWTIRLSSVEFPTYINRVLGFSVQTASTCLALTYLVAYFDTFLVSGISQYMINRNYLSTGTCRKICNSIACWGSALTLIIISIFPLNNYCALFLILLTFIFTNVSFSGFCINYNDLSSNYCGCLFGIGGLMSTAISFLPTTLVQFMVPDESDPTQWARAFLLAALITSAGNIFYVFEGSGDVQDWDNILEEEDEETTLLEKST